MSVQQDVSAARVDFEAFRSMMAWLMVGLVPLGFHYFMATENLFDDKQLLFLSLVAGAVLLWIFRLVPDFVPGLALVIIVVLLNLVPQDVAFNGFGSEVFFLVFGVFILSMLLSESTWFDWVTAVMNRRNASFRSGIWTILGAGALLTLMVPSPLGRASMVQPMVKRLWRPEGRQRNSALAAAHIHGTTILSTIVLTGNPLNFILIGLLAEQSQSRFAWVGWITATWFAGIFLCVSMVLLFAFWGRNAARADGVAEAASPHSEVEPLPPIGLGDWATLGLYGLLFAAILGRDIHQIPLQWIVMLLAVSVFFFSGISQKVLRSKFDWQTLVFIATVVAWGPMLDQLELSTKLADSLSFLVSVFELESIKIGPLFFGLVDQFSINLNGFYLGLFTMIAVVLVVRLVVPGAPAFILLASTLMPMADSIGMSPWVVGFIIVTMSEAFIWPYQHGVYSQTVTELETEGVAYSSGVLLVTNIFFLLMRCVAILLCVSWWMRIDLI